MINFIKLYWGHLRSSRKTIVLSTIGLIFAIAIVSSSILYVDTAKQDIIDTTINYSSTNPYEIEFEIRTGDVNVSFDSVNAQINSLGLSVINLAKINFLNKLQLFDSIYSVDTPRITFLSNGSQTLVDRNLNIIELNSGLIHDLQRFLNKNSSLPGNGKGNISHGFLLDTYFGSSSNTVLKKINQENVSNYTQGSTINIYNNYENYSASFQVILTGYGKIVNFDQFNSNLNQYTVNYNAQLYPALAKLWQIEPYGTTSSYLFVQNLTQFLSNYKSNFYYHNNLSNVTIDALNAGIFGGYTINYNKFDPFTISSKINAIESLQATIKDKIYGAEFYKSLDQSNTFFFIRFIDYSKLSTVLNVVYQILYDMFLYALPMIVVALLVTSYSFGLVEKKLLSQIGIYKTRGMRARTFLFFQLLDYLIIIFGATLVGMLLGIPITDVVAKTNSILNFSNTENYDVLTNFLTILPYFFIILFVFAIIVGFIISIRRITHLSRMSINESENPIEKQDPYWKVHYIDVIVFLYGLVSYLLITYFFNSTANSTQSLQAGIFFLILFIPAPFAIVIGTTLFANRFIPILLDLISTKLWQKYGGLLAFSFKNIIRHRHSSTRGVILVATLVTFLILFYTVPASQVNYENRSSQYELGGELQIIPNNFINQNFVNSVGSISTVKNQTTDFIHSIQTTFNNSIRGISPVLKVNIFTQEFAYVFLFINASTFYQASSVSLFNLGLRNSLTYDLQQLSHHNANYPIIVPNSYLSISNSKIGGNLNINFQNSNSSNFNIIDSFNEWPMTSRNLLNSNFMIMDLSFFYNVLVPEVNNNGGFINYNESYVLNFKDGVNIPLVADEISQLSGATVVQAKNSLQNWDQISFLIFKFRLGQINIDLIISLLISVTILLMFAYMQLNDRRQEIFTERAIGMKKYQTAFIFYIESVILLFCGLIIGSFVSIYFMQTLVIFLTGGFTIPRYEIIVPLNIVFWTYVILILIDSLCSIIPSYLLSKNDIIQTFAYEN